MAQLIMQSRGGKICPARLLDPKDVPGNARQALDMFYLEYESSIDPSQLELIASVPIKKMVDTADKYQLYGSLSPLVRVANEFADSRSASHYELVSFGGNIAAIQAYNLRS